LKEYLSEKEEKDMLTTAQVWKQEGLQEGEQKKARFVIIRGLLKNYTYSDLADLTDLPIEQISKIAEAFNLVKAEWHNKNVKDLTKITALSEEEIKFIVARLGQMS
jgi:DNA integrity scanning protein DisA with diadenylate cyclase activity